MHEVGIHAPGCFRSHGNRDSMFLQDERQSWYLMLPFHLKALTQCSLKPRAKKTCGIIPKDWFYGMLCKKMHLFLQQSPVKKQQQQQQEDLSRIPRFSPVIHWFECVHQTESRQVLSQTTWAPSSGEERLLPYYELSFSWFLPKYKVFLQPPWMKISWKCNFFAFHEYVSFFLQKDLVFF